ncbi:hypothetical protein A1351_19200 [Methylosinus sp. R-45379]|nr:hypothetical protein A1351_19200 [Methylosinus sp. R-45379]
MIFPAAVFTLPVSAAEMIIELSPSAKKFGIATPPIVMQAWFPAWAFPAWAPDAAVSAITAATADRNRIFSSMRFFS